MDRIWISFDQTLGYVDGGIAAPAASTYQLGSWIEKAAGLGDMYGTAGITRQIYSTNPFVPGARFAREESSGFRTMRFPLLVPSGGLNNITGSVAGEAGAPLDWIESMIRLSVRPGNFLDILPHNSEYLTFSGAGATALMNPIRFDILGGQVYHREYSVDLQRHGYRRLWAEIHTQPFGYWPTWVKTGVIATQGITNASFGMWGAQRLQIQVSGNIKGDVPGIVRLSFYPTGPTQNASNGAIGGFTPYMVDGLAWANGGKPYFLPAIAGASLTGWSFVGSYKDMTGVGQPPLGATAFQIPVPPASNGWALPFNYLVPAGSGGYGLAAAYSGRFRAYAALHDSGGRPNQVTLDAVAQTTGNVSFSIPMASANKIATMMPSYVNGFGLYDLGEITLPPGASHGGASGFYLRLWSTRASSGASSFLYGGGLWLQSLDGQAGILNGGMAMPSIGLPTVSQSQDGVTLHTQLGVYNNGGDLRRYYNGQLPLVGASQSAALAVDNSYYDILWFQRIPAAASSPAPPFSGTKAYGSVAAHYRPQFSFQRWL